jgi:hypothetical protein
MNATTFPLPVTSDPEDVSLALETAHALWKKLDYAEAVRWLRRAALAAGESGDDLRGVRLATAAADISAELSASGHAPSTSSTLREPRFGPPPLPSRTTSSAPPSAVAPSRPKPPSPPAEIEPEPVLKSDPAILPEVDPDETAVVGFSPPLTPLPPPSVFPSSQVGTSSPSGGPVSGLRAFRVSVQRSPDGALTVRSLPDGDKLPAGAREAILVFSGSTRGNNGR